MMENNIKRQIIKAKTNANVIPCLIKEIEKAIIMGKVIREERNGGDGLPAQGPSRVHLGLSKRGPAAT